MRVVVRGPAAAVDDAVARVESVSGVSEVVAAASAGSDDEDDRGDAERDDEPSRHRDEPGEAVVVAVGESAVRRAVLAEDEDRSAPILAVDAPGPHAVAAEDVATALAGVVAGESATVSAPVLTVRAGSIRADAAFDVSLLTSEAARISGYGVHEGGRTHGRFRADGVVVATPMGSYGYARAAGGPLLSPETGLAVVPVSPFTTEADAWVVDRRVRVTVERDEGEVSLFADDGAVGRLDEGDVVSVSVDRHARVVAPDELPE